jgi:nicotinamide mononucleotide transporter
LNATLDRLLAEAAALSAWEAAAVLLAALYLVLVIRQNIWCWPVAILSTVLYVFVMYGAGLYMESALQIFYIGVAVYGWRHWLNGRRAEAELPVTTWPLRRHIALAAGIVAASLASGAVLSAFTAAAMPYLDSFTTWGAVVSTWMVARKLLENWLYWFVIDGVSVYLYLSRDLYLTAALFVVYLVMIVAGFRAWRRSMRPAAP